MRLIDADALAMHMADWQLSVCSEQYDTIEEAIDAVTSAPTIDAVPVRNGRWESGEENSWWCSECDEEFYLEDGTPQENGYRYCPNCGARMDGEK